MRDFLNILFIAAILFISLSSGWVCYSAQKVCPTDQPGLTTEQFMSAHGIAQGNFSLWLKEHSEWRRKNEEELQCYSFIPKQGSVAPRDFDPHRR